MENRTALENEGRVPALVAHDPEVCAPSPSLSGTTLPQDGRLVTGRRPVLLMLGGILPLDWARRNPFLVERSPPEPGALLVIGPTAAPLQWMATTASPGRPLPLRKGASFISVAGLWSQSGSRTRGPRSGRADRGRDKGRGQPAGATLPHALGLRFTPTGAMPLRPERTSGH